MRQCDACSSRLEKGITERAISLPITENLDAIINLCAECWEKYRDFTGKDSEEADTE